MTTRRGRNPEKIPALKSPVVSLDRNNVFALIANLVSAELEHSRRNRFDGGEMANWIVATPLGEGGLEMDSIELLQVSSAVDEFFHLHETGIEEYLLRHRSLGQWCDIVLQAFPRGHRHFTFRTSGSQGTAQSHSHRVSTLLQEISTWTRVFRGRRRIIAPIVPHHIYGFLFSILLPHTLKVPLLAVRHWPVGKILHALAPGDLMVGHPLFWQQLQLRARRLPADVYGVTSTAPCDPRIIESLKELGLARMTEVYGASETGGIGYRHDPARAYRLLGHWLRVPRKGKDGLQFALKRAGSKAMLAPDLLDWRGTRTFRPIARRDHAVQVAGINVYPLDIARRLREHPAVADCAVRPTGAAESDRLKAFIVLKKNYNSVALRPQLEQWIYERFTAPERPVALTFGKSLPATSAGKLADW
jgi:long-chain acyl-CoA synthetase